MSTATATTFTVPTRDEVSPANQGLFDKLQGGLGMVPNLYATFAHSGTALGDYLALQNRKSSLRAKEREVINLVVSQVNECEYCLAAHTVIGTMQGFTAEQVLELRSGRATFDPKFDALARFVHDTAENRGKPSDESTARLLAAGYTQENVVDIVITIGDKVITNYLHGVTRVAVDFPAAPSLDGATPPCETSCGCSH
ncbi:MAG: carboxymuconolactone decarboxylase family protein [Lacipirellulaceae bacterium]